MVTQTGNRFAQVGNIDKEELDILQTIAGLSDAPQLEPSDKVVHTGDDRVPAIARTKSTSAGYVQLRRNSDGKLVLISKSQLVERLKQRLPNGKPAWLPPQQAWAGHVTISTSKCMLHADDPDRATWDELGLPVCVKSNMPKQAVRRHMIRKHKMAWDAIQDYLAEQKQDARDKHQETLAKGIQQALGANRSHKKG